MYVGVGEYMHFNVFVLITILGKVLVIFKLLGPRRGIDYDPL